MTLLLPQNIRRAFSLGHGSAFEGVFYTGRPLNDHPPIQNTLDFAFSPIPFRFWPKVGRIRFRLNNRPGAVEALSKALSNHGVSIIYSEYSRTAHRYSIWNVVVIFEIVVYESQFDPETTTYKPTLQALSALPSKMCAEAADYLFVDKEDIRHRNAIDIWPLSSLSYFHHVSRSLRSVAQEGWQYESFRLDSQPEGLVTPKSSRFPAILGKYFPKDEQHRTCAYADFSTTDVLLRVAIIPNDRLHRFAEIVVKYERFAPPDSSRGFCAHITGMVPQFMRIWHMNNFTNENEEYVEKGSMNLLVEDTHSTEGDEGDVSRHFLELREEIKHTPFLASIGQSFIIEAGVKPLCQAEVRNRLFVEESRSEEGEIRFDVFVSYANQDRDLARRVREALEHADLTCFMANRDLPKGPGAVFSDEIRAAILRSREMVLLWSQHASKSEWVCSEWSAFWILGRIVTPVLYQTTADSLPLRLRQLECADAADLAPFVAALSERKAHYRLMESVSVL